MQKTLLFNIVKSYRKFELYLILKYIWNFVIYSQEQFVLESVLKQNRQLQ